MSRAVRRLCALTTLSAGALLVTPAYAQFDWGSDCESGSGSFQQSIPFRATATVGEIPPNKADVEINLDSDVDVDIQLIDQATGTEIIAWPSGMLNGATEQCTTYQGVRYCYSGYNGAPGEGWGHEWIRVEGVTNRTLIMKAYGYQAGAAPVTYSFSADDTCNETGSGEFAQQIQQNAIVTVGDIPQGKTNVVIELEAQGGRDVDVQLYDGNVALVKWPDGQLSGATQQTLEYRGMTIIYSGYNGIGGNWGRERIEIRGELTATLTMRAFGYQAGFADVTYRWGEGAGDSCTSDASCDAGLSCKRGTCHTSAWCESDSTVAADCGDASASCVEFECSSTGNNGGGGTGPTCGDNICEGGETCSSCSADCGACGPTCGDNVCEGGETCGSCSADCGACGPTCGDNICEAGETCNSCSADCGPCGGSSSWSAGELEMLDLVNGLRASGTNCGGTWYPPVGPVSADDNLREAAFLHSQDMGQNNYFSHTGLNGSSPFDRMYAAGYTGFAASENIAAGNSAAQATFQQWVNSPGHCVNMMSGSVNELGVGHAHVPGSAYNHYWTQNFGNQ